MNKINVIDKTEKLTLGSTYELRGNFVEQKDEEGNISYECDMFRTTNKNDTFEKLFKEKQVKEAKDYLASTVYVNDNFTTAQALDKVDEFLAEVSNTYNITNQEIMQKRWEARALINEIGE